MRVRRSARSLWLHGIAALLACVVVVAAIAWVSVPFTDRTVSCGSAIVRSVRHGVKVPGATANAPFVTLCIGEARRRVGESATLIVLVGIGVAVDRRRSAAARPR